MSDLLDGYTQEEIERAYDLLCEQRGTRIQPHEPRNFKQRSLEDIRLELLHKHPKVNPLTVEEEVQKLRDFLFIHGMKRCPDGRK